jgi:hypothetical protein
VANEPVRLTRKYCKYIFIKKGKTFNYIFQNPIFASQILI